MKDKIKKDLDWNFNAKDIRRVVEKAWKEYTMEQINYQTASMVQRIQACIEDKLEAANSFIFLILLPQAYSFSRNSGSCSGS